MISISSKIRIYVLIDYVRISMIGSLLFPNLGRMFCIIIIMMSVHVLYCTYIQIENLGRDSEAWHTQKQCSYCTFLLSHPIEETAKSC